MDVPDKSALDSPPAPTFFSSSNVHSHSGYSSSSFALTFGLAFVYPSPRRSWPPGTELLTLIVAGFLGSPLTAAPSGFALEVDGVCGSERGCEIPWVREDCVGLTPSIEMEAGAGVGAGVGGTAAVDA